MKVLTLCGKNIADFTIVLPFSQDNEPKPAEKTAAEFIKRGKRTKKRSLNTPRSAVSGVANYS